METIPEALKEIKNLKCFEDESRKIAIYFLTRNGKVVYVGKSIDVISRIKQHYTESRNNGPIQCGGPRAKELPRKIFDRSYYFECMREEINALEKYFIETFLPEYNLDVRTEMLRKYVVA